MSSVDNRIVHMKFDNAAFEKGAAVTMGTLDKLKKSLDFTGSTKGMQDVQSSVDKFHTGTMDAAITGISAKFLALSAVAVTALTNITNKAVDAGMRIAKSLTIEPIGAGFREFELKMGSIQTIMAGSGESLEVVNQYLKELNEYSDQTIYSFADMTTNIGKFTNAGISLKDSVASIKGVANVAAISGANAEEASRAMYNFAQALSSGSVKLQDWKSIELANMGTKEFKQQLIDSAVAAGTLTKGVDGMYKTLEGTPVSATKGFNESLQDQWLTTEALTETLGRYSDATTDIGARATAAAQDVKTFSQMLDTLKESAGSGWAETWELVFGNFEESKQLWTGLNNFFGGFITRSADARNKILEDWKTLGGRTALIEGIKNIFSALLNIMKPIKEAFRDIFPAMTGERLAEITKNFREFTENLRLGHTTIQNIKRTFAGLFAVFSIFKTIISAVIGGIANIFGALWKNSDKTGEGILGITANIGDFLVKIDEMLKKSGFLKTFFGGIGTAIGTAAAGIRNFIAVMGALVAGKSSVVLDNLYEKFDALKPIIDAVRSGIEKFVNGLKSLASGFSMEKLFSGLSSGSVANLAKGGMFAAIGIGITKFVTSVTASFDSLKGLFDGFAGTFETAQDVLKQVTSNLKTMQADVRSEIILKIAASLALLAVAIFILSKVDIGDLVKSLAAVSALLAIMAFALKKLEEQTSAFGSAKLAVIAGAMVALAAAMVLMAVAVGLFGMMSPETLTKGITAIAATLAVVIGAVALLDKTGGQAKLIVTAAALLILAAALTAFAGAIKVYSLIDTGSLVEGGAKIAASLGLLAILMRAMPKNMLVTAAGLFVVATALTILAGALKILGSMSGGEMAKALFMLGASLLIIAIALKAMNSAIMGAVAILIFAAALNILIPPLLVLANLSWAQLGMALLALVAIFTVLGLAGLALGPVVPVILALAAAILLLGAGMLLAGAGMFLFATGLSLLVGLGVAGIAMLIQAVKAMAELIPTIMAQVALGVVAFIATIAKNTPNILKAFGEMLDAILDFIVEYAPKLYKTGFDLLTAFLDVLIDRTPELADKGGDLIVAFIEGIGKQQLKIIKAAGDTLLDFLEGLTDWLNDNEQRIHDVGHDLAEAIIDGVIAGVTGLGSGVGDALMDMASGAWSRVTSFFDTGSPSKLAEELGRWIDQGLAIGVEKNSPVVDSSMEDMGISAVSTFQKTLTGLADAVETEMEVEPVIAPVIDLTKVRAGADRIGAMLETKPLATDVSFNQAASIAASKTATESTEVAPTAEAGGNIIFEQNNYSPKSLSAIEIYRNTRNQLSLAKEALAV